MVYKCGLWVVLATNLSIVAPVTTIAQQATAQYPFSGARTVTSRQPFDAVVDRLEKAIAANKMGLVAQASASRGTDLARSGDRREIA